MRPLEKIDDAKRTRLKVTFIAMGLVTLLSFFPMHVILRATTFRVFEIAAAWTAWGLCVAGIGSIAGYYVNKETVRGSLFGIGMGVITGKTPIYKTMKNHEDESDPEDIPL